MQAGARDRERDRIGSRSRVRVKYGLPETAVLDEAAEEGLEQRETIGAARDRFGRALPLSEASFSAISSTLTEPEPSSSAPFEIESGRAV